MSSVTNWAGNVRFASELQRPRSVEELQELVAAADKVRVLGTGHSFNRIADSTGTLVSVQDLPAIVEVGDRGVTVSAGLRYGEITAALEARGLALHNLGSLPHISVAGACSTGTHGSGDSNRPLAAADGGRRLLDRYARVRRQQPSARRRGQLDHVRHRGRRAGHAQP